jgi:hypothetical protein
MKKIALSFKSIILLTLVLTSCKKEDVKCSDDTAFCSFIDKADFNNTSSVINKYLAGQEKKLSENEKLEQLRDWLKCKSCVSSAEILCNSCIYTNPAQSELKVSFIVNGQQVEKCLDVIMDEPLSVRAYHDK